MTPRLVIGLAVAAVVATGAATAAWQANNAVIDIPGAGEPLFPGLIDKVNDVRTIKITQEGETLALSRNGEDWELAGSGYPIDSDKLKKQMVGVVRLEKMEPKTARKEKYPLIELGDPSREGTESRRMVLEDGEGKELANIVLGKVAWGRAGPGQGAQYIRLEGDDQTWLVKGLINARAVIDDWVDITVYKTDRNNMTRLKTRHSDDGEEFEIAINGKTLAGTPKYEITGLPASAKVKDKSAVRNALLDLARLDLRGVRKAKAEGKPVSVTEVETSEGLKLEMPLYKEGKEFWVGVKVIDKGKNAALADEITKKADGWQFEIADSKADQFMRRLKDFVEVTEVTPQPAPQSTPVPAPATNE